MAQTKMLEVMLTNLAIVAERAALILKLPHVEPEVIRTNLTFVAEQAVLSLITCGRQSLPKLDEQAMKALRVVVAVLGFFSEASLNDQQTKTLDRLYGVLEARDLTAQERVRLAVALTEEYGRAFNAANDDETRERCADDYVLSLGHTVDPKWNTLRATTKRLEVCKVELGAWRSLQTPKKRGTHNAFGVLARLNQFVGVAGFGRKGAAHVERTQKAIEAAYSRPMQKLAETKTRVKARKKRAKRGSRAS